MAKFLVTSIKWDVMDDEEDLEALGELPTTLEVDVEDDEVEDWTDDSEVGDVLADKISDMVGFCHDSFDWQRLDNPASTTTHINE